MQKGEIVKRLYALTDGQQIRCVRVFTHAQWVLERRSAANRDGGNFNWIELSPMEYIGDVENVSL